MLHIYTGEGKGKTTAAAGLAIRALGWKKKVVWCSFYKNLHIKGELKILSDLGVKIYQFSKLDKWAKEELKNIIKEKPEILILDEINLGILFREIKVEELIEILKLADKETEIVLTGRYCSDELCIKADLVTYMAEIKHPYSYKGIKARQGVD
jgi:cob(I)alamin adenosyltransferase